MKVTEKITRPNGTSQTREFNIALEKGRSAICWTLAPKNEEPFSVRILKSGWFDHGNPMYHVLTEWGAYEETSYSHLTQDQLLERYPEFQEILLASFQDTLVTSDNITRLPNDTDLGRFVRKESLNGL